MSVSAKLRGYCQCERGVESQKWHLLLLGRVCPRHVGHLRRRFGYCLSCTGHLPKVPAPVCVKLCAIQDDEPSMQTAVTIKEGSASQVMSTLLL